MRFHRSLVAIPAALLLLLASCGDDDEPDDATSISADTDAGDDEPDATPPADEPDAEASDASDEGAFDDFPDDPDGDPEIDGPFPDTEGDVEYAVFEELDVEPGGEPVTVEGNVVRAEPRDAYVVDAPGGAGEQLYLTITSLEDNASVFVYGPDGSVVPGGEDVMDATIDLVESGTYLIEVGPTRGNTTYELTVGVSVPAD